MDGCLNKLCICFYIEEKSNNSSGKDQKHQETGFRR